MLVGWRMGDDLEVLAVLPDGTLSIDALSGSASHDIAGDLQLYVAGELASWLAHRLSVHQIPLQAIAAATVTAKIRTDLLPTARGRIVCFDFFVQSAIVTGERSYIGKLHEVNRWHTQMPSKNSFKPKPLRGST
ncbi:hypothetical protein EER27_06555 [Lysobacter psychrotolerans]|uniref:Uncharacterized protein n=2 Tax=Montanilutibacter psychrotolerans TaxID=1327343 RepID=A0A3M8SX78_9GAMM|nr:hypothetical protein EER27_06555 [Lysobacter psychrotolerans]